MHKRRITIEYNLDKEMYERILKEDFSKVSLRYVFETILYGKITLIDTQTGTTLSLELDVLRFTTSLYEIVRLSLKNDRHQDEISDIYQSYCFKTKVKDGYIHIIDLNKVRKFKLKKLSGTLIAFQEKLTMDIPKLYPEIVHSKHWKMIVHALKTSA